jgi:hypothetical protein
MDPTTGLMQMLFWRKIFEDEHCPSPWLLQPSTFYYFYYYPELLLISYVKPIEKYLAFEPRTGIKLHSTHRVSSQRRDAKINKKFDMQLKFKKQKNMLPKGRILKSIDW